MRAPAALAAVLAILALSACGERGEVRTVPAGTAQTRLTIALAGPLSALYGPILAAQASGALTRAQLAVTSSPSSSGAAALERLSTGGADVAVASEPDLLAARARGEQLVSIGALAQGPLEALISVEPHAVSQITQLRGRTVATTGQPLQDAELDTMLAAAHVDPAPVQRHPAGTNPTGALSNTVVAALGGYWNYDAVALERRRRRPTAIGVQAAGVPAFTELALVVRVAEAHHEGPVLRGLLHALSGAAVNLRADPQPALGALLAGAPGLDRGFELAVLQRTVPLLLPSTRALPFGYQDPRAWGAFGAWMLAHHLISRPARAELAVTNEFLPGQGE